SIYASLYTDRLAAHVPAAVAGTSGGSLGAALTSADTLARAGHPELARSIHDAASAAFFDGFRVANLVAAGVTAVGALIALALLPAHPTIDSDDEPATHTADTAVAVTAGH